MAEMKKHIRYVPNIHNEPERSENHYRSILALTEMMQALQRVDKIEEYTSQMKHTGRSQDSRNSNSHLKKQPHDAKQPFTTIF